LGLNVESIWDLERTTVAISKSGTALTDANSVMYHPASRLCGD
jgi:hypothetical protein